MGLQKKDAGMKRSPIVRPVTVSAVTGGDVDNSPLGNGPRIRVSHTLTDQPPGVSVLGGWGVLFDGWLPLSRDATGLPPWRGSRDGLSGHPSMGSTNSAEALDLFFQRAWHFQECWITYRATFPAVGRPL